MADFV